MKRDDIINLMQQACDPDKKPAWHNEFWTITQQELERFADLVLKAEREACKDLWEAQKLTDRQISDHIVAAVEAEREACAAIANEHKEHCYDGDQDWYKCRSIEAAIRARGNK